MRVRGNKSSRMRKSNKKLAAKVKKKREAKKLQKKKLKLAKSKGQIKKSNLKKSSFSYSLKKYQNLPLRDRMLEKLKSSRFRYANYSVLIFEFNP